MSDLTTWLIAAAIVGAFIAGIYVMITTLCEAERRLERDLSLTEIILITFSMPYSGAYIWLALTGPKAGGGE